jgi:hypothetical protein
MVARATVEQWRNLLAALQKGNFIAAARFERRYKTLGAANAVLQAIVATAIFTTATNGQPVAIRYVAGVIAAVTATITAILNVLSYERLVQQHKAAGLNYGALRRQLEELLAFSDESAAPSQDIVKSVRERWDAVDQESPPLPQTIYDKATAEFASKG